MFTPRDQNHLPAAPAVKIPTLSSPNNGMAVGSTYAPSLSLRRRFGPAPQTLEVREVVTDARQTPVAELDVHECDVPSGTAEWPSFREEVMELDDKKRANELHKVGDVTALNMSPRGATNVTNATLTAVTAENNDDCPQGEFLLQKGEFLERLVQRVRASCTNVIKVDDEGEEDLGGNQADQERIDHSALPLRTSTFSLSSPLMVQWRDYDDNMSDGEGVAKGIVPPAKAPSRSRSRSPSPLSSPSLPQRIFTADINSQRGVHNVISTHTASPLKSPVVGLQSRATSPDPRAPSTDFFAAGGAMRNSLQHSRCSGVSRSRRSLSAERPEPDGDDDFSVAVPETKVEKGEGDAFWLRAGSIAAAGQHGSSLSSERVSMSATQHPQWVPHPVPQARPAWNQRQPPKRQRPVVSAPGSNPPPPSRRSVARSLERASTSTARLTPAQTTTSFSLAGPQHSAERALRRSASLPTVQVQPRATTSERFSVTAPRLAIAFTSAPKASPQDMQVMTGQSPIEGTDATTSPPSPPSARALFQSIEVDSATRTTPLSVTSTGAAAAATAQQQEHGHQQHPSGSVSARRSPSLAPSTLQQTCDAALERAARAEKQCGVLTLALEQLLVERASEKAEWQSRISALEQQLSKVTQWITSIDAEANLTVPEVQAAPPPVSQAIYNGDSAAATNGAAPRKSNDAIRDTGLARPPLLTRVVMGKPVMWEEEEEEAGSHHGSGGSAGRSADVSPLPGVPGATPTPGRRDSASGDSRGTSTCQTRLPPSPPIILHLHAQQ